MTVAEYVLVLVSIVLGLGIAAVLTSFHRLLAAGTRVKWAVLPVLTAVLVIMLSLMLWWSQFPNGDESRPLTIGQFLPLFAVFVLVFLTAASAFPSEIPPEEIDLGVWYRDNSPRYWVFVTLATATTLFAEGAAPVATDGWSGLVRFLLTREIDLLVLVLFGSLVFVRARWWHYVVLLIVSSGPITWVSRSIG